jgi:hypothetical protein
MTVYAPPPPAHVARAAQIVEDFIKGQQAATRVDAAMAVVREWLAVRQRRLNDGISYEQ